MITVSALVNLKTFLENHLNKPSGIYVTQREVSSAGKEVMTLNDIVAFERKNLRVFTNEDVITVHVLQYRIVFLKEK